MITYQATTSVFVLVTLIGQVVCATAESAKVRLVNGESPYDGQVEVYDKTIGSWLPVLYNGDINNWGFKAADIVCKELGFPGVMLNSRKPDSLRGDKRLRIYNIVCENKRSLVDCDHEIGEKPEDTTAANVRCLYDGYSGRYKYRYPSGPQHNISGRHVTIQACLEYCRKQPGTYRFIGLRSGDWCYCISDLSKFDKSEFGVSMKCSGDNSQICGSWDRYDIYSISVGACGGHLYLDETTTIYSPGFPGSYLPNVICSWTLETSIDRVLGTDFTFLNIGRHDDLSASVFFDGGWHYVDILNAPAYFCSNKLQLSFVSLTRDNSAKGSFVMKFRARVPDCQPPFNITYQSVISEGVCPYFHGDIVSILCKEGYRLDRAHRSIECMEDGTWNDTMPKCAAIDCGSPGDVDDAEIDEEDDSFTYNSSVRYACHEGYHINGSDVITCTDIGNWTSKPICVKTLLIIAKESAQTVSMFGIGAIMGTAVTVVVVGITAAILLTVFIYRRKSSKSQHTVKDEPGDFVLDEIHQYATID